MMMKQRQKKVLNRKRPQSMKQARNPKMNPSPKKPPTNLPPIRLSLTSNTVRAVIRVIGKMLKGK